MSSIFPNLSGASIIKDIDTRITEKAVTYYGEISRGTVSENFGGLDTAHNGTCVQRTQSVAEYSSQLASKLPANIGDRKGVARVSGWKMATHRVAKQQNDRTFGRHPVKDRKH